MKPNHMKRVMLANDEKNRPVPISRLKRESVCMWTLNDRPEACIFSHPLCFTFCCFLFE